MKTFQCAKCGHRIRSEDDRVPAWCGKCGADIMPSMAVAASVEELADAALPGGRAKNADASAHLEKERTERFSKQNVLVGLGLAIWGFVMSGLMGGGNDPTDKILAAHPKLVSLLNWLQMLTCVSGVILCLSGYAVREHKPWGYAVAGACGLFLIANGLVFFVAFNRIGTGRELEDGVAKVRIVRENFDMLIGLVEGVFLLYFLAKYRLSKQGGLES